MITQFRFDAPSLRHSEHLSRTATRILPLTCPECREPLELSIGLCGRRQVDAILLQSQRIGSELECHRCGVRFVYHRAADAMVEVPSQVRPVSLSLSRRK